MLISAVILSFNSEPYLGACLTSLVDAFGCLDGECEVFVVENGSRDGSPNILKRFAQRYSDLVIPIYNSENRGTTVARNLALRRARGRYILVLDSDVIVPRKALDELISVLDDTPSCGLVAPRLVYPDGRPQISTDKFPTVGSKLIRLLFLNRLKQREDWRNHDPVPVDYAISAFWLFRRDLLSEVGYLDERYFYAPEDVDYCASIWLAGYRILYIPTIQAIHDAQELSRKRRLSRFTFHHIYGLLLFFAKHLYIFSASRLYRRIGRARKARSPTEIDVSFGNQ